MGMIAAAAVGVLSFVWIEGDSYNLLDAHLHRLPFRGWVLHPNNVLRHEETESIFVPARRQPNDPYVLLAHEVGE